jgi:hypothetical protein
VLSSAPAPRFGCCQARTPPIDGGVAQPSGQWIAVNEGEGQ